MRLVCSWGRHRKCIISDILHRERRFTRRRRLSLLHLLCKCGAHPRVVAAFDRSRYNQSERAKSFLQHNNSVVFAMRSFANEKMKNPEKSEKKVLTKWRRSDIITKLSGRWSNDFVKLKSRLKKLKKSLEKPLDKAAAKWYNKQAVDRKVTANRSLKIEQQ